MKRIVRWLCPVLFLLICASVIWSLHLFVEVKGHMEYITWDSSVQILSDGTEVPFETDTYSNISDTKGSYRFSGRLPEGLPAGSLFFETSGCSVTLSLNGTEIYRSSAAASQDAAMMSQATIPLPQGTTGTITMDYTVSDSYGAMFPPLLRFIPTFFTDIQSTAFANRAALPAGAAALAFLLVTGLFLLGVMSRQPDLRLLPLMGATLGLTFYQMIQEQGLHFLPEAVWQFFSRPSISLGIIFLLLLYLFVNRSRHFFRHLSIVTAWSAAGLTVAYVISLWQGSYLSSYINSEISILINNGIYSGLTYWLTLWLAIVCAAILQDAALRAAQSDVRFDTQVHLPEKISVSEQDLCILLMNMLDNALEACGKITDKEQRHIQFRSEIKNDFLTISCKNTFSEKPKKDRHGRIITSKSDALSHGFGIRQMESIAQKYHSILDISYEMGGFFSVQTALRLPETKEHRNKPPEQPTRTAQNIS